MIEYSIRTRAPNKVLLCPPVMPAKELLPLSNRTLLYHLCFSYYSQFQSYNHYVGWVINPFIPHYQPPLQKPRRSKEHNPRGYVGNTWRVSFRLSTCPHFRFTPFLTILADRVFSSFGPNRRGHCLLSSPSLHIHSWRSPPSNATILTNS